MPFTLRTDYSTQARGGAECSFCGSGLRSVDMTDPNGPRERVIDSDIFIDTEGIFEFCETCGIEIGNLIGMIEEPIATGLKVENAALRKRAERAEKDLAAAKDAFLTATQYTIADRDALAAPVTAAGGKAGV